MSSRVRRLTFCCWLVTGRFGEWRGNIRRLLAPFLTADVSLQPSMDGDVSKVPVQFLHPYCHREFQPLCYQLYSCLAKLMEELCD